MKKSKIHTEFETGWRVLVHLPTRAEVQQGTVGDMGKSKRDGRRGLWVRVKVGNEWFLVPETSVEHKTDEPYCVEFVKELQQASLVRKGKKIVRERIITPTYEKGFLKPLYGSDWKYRGLSVNKMQAKVLDATYQRLASTC